MNSLFSYESKPMQILMFLGDLIILNLIYLLCCIPVFTIGAAQAGLHNAARVLLDKEDDSSPTAAFFRGFTSGFGTVTLSWGLMTILLLLIIYLGVAAMNLGAPVWIVLIAIAVCVIFQTLIPAFHSRFGCTATQLIRNVWFLVFAHPLRSIATGLVVWLPLGAFLLMDLFDFMALTPIWGTLYYSTAFVFASVFLKKPFNTLVDHFNKTHETDDAPAQESAETTAEEESPV